VFVNSRVEHCTGHTPDEIVQADQDLYTKMIHQEDLEHVVTQRKKIQKSKDGELITMKYRIQNLDGKWTHQFSLGLVFSRDESGKSKQYIGVATDITDLQNTNELLQDKNRELEHSNIELASFSSIASHDLQEPLRKIQLFLNLVLQKENDRFSKESQDYLKRVIVSAHRMQQLINDLISYSRTSAQKIEYTNTDFNKLLVEVLDDLKENIEGTGSVIEVGHLPHASIIPSQFRQLFVNLIANALKFRRLNVEPHINISSEIMKAEEIRSLGEDPEKTFCKISVIDNGIGFPDEQKFKIFEPFQRLHGKEEYSGTGIGLAICKKIVANHHGMITAESGEGKGATFSIYIPLKN
jgi:PAS domain S-box-containing protein